MQYLLLATAMWHTLAVYFFLFRATSTLASFTHEAPVSPVAADMMRFLGGLNLGYALLAAWAAWHLTALVETSVLLAVANGSQFVLDLRAHRTGRWLNKLVAITLLDGFFMVAYVIPLIYLLS